MEILTDRESFLLSGTQTPASMAKNVCVLYLLFTVVVFVVRLDFVYGLMPFSYN